jgi:hypothetical protein
MEEKYTSDSERVLLGGFVVLCSKALRDLHIIGFAGLILALEGMCIQDDPGAGRYTEVL